MSILLLIFIILVPAGVLWMTFGGANLDRKKSKEQFWGFVIFMIFAIGISLALLGEYPHPRLLIFAPPISIHLTQIFFLIFEQKLAGVNHHWVEAISAFHLYKMTSWGRTRPNSQLFLPIWGIERCWFDPGLFNSSPLYVYIVRTKFSVICQAEEAE